jgi:hypothetical protein
MDATGAAVGIAFLGIQLCQGLCKYYISWKGYRDDIKSTFDSIERFEQTLTLLESTAATSSQHAPELIKHIAGCILACQEGTNRLRKKFEKIKEKTPTDSVLM